VIKNCSYAGTALRFSPVPHFFVILSFLFRSDVHYQLSLYGRAADHFITSREAFHVFFFSAICFELWGCTISDGFVSISSLSKASGDPFLYFLFYLASVGHFKGRSNVNVFGGL